MNKQMTNLNLLNNNTSFNGANGKLRPVITKKTVTNTGVSSLNTNKKVPPAQPKTRGASVTSTLKKVKFANLSNYVFLLFNEIVL